MENIDDNELIQRARMGDKDALDFLMEKYTQLASKVARSYFLVGADYEDLLQIAMIGLFNAYNNYDENGQASFATFARLCIERNIQSAVKKANTEKHKILSDAVTISSKDDDGEISIVIPTYDSPDVKLEHRERLEQIKQQIINSLSDFELKVLFLYLKGYTYTQIAQKLDLSNKSIDNALSRIKHKLAYLKKN